MLVYWNGLGQDQLQAFTSATRKDSLCVENKISYNAALFNTAKLACESSNKIRSRLKTRVSEQRNSHTGQVLAGSNNPYAGERNSILW